MPAYTLHLVSLSPSTTISNFLDTLRSSALQPLIVAKVIRWIITPTSLSVNELLHPPRPWHLFLLLPSDPNTFPSNLESLVSAHWSIKAGIPSRLLQDFPARNRALIHPVPNTIPPLTGALSSPRLAKSSQTLELSPDLREWISGPATSELTHKKSTAVSMLNLLSFHSDPAAKESYLKYGSSFAQSIGSRRGGLAKIVGSVIQPVVPSKNTAGTEREELRTAGCWDEIALAHYPSIQHFGDMIASADYQEVNQRYRVGSLKDTAILCLSEGAVEGMWEKEGRYVGSEGGGGGGGGGEGAMGMEDRGVRSKL